MCRPTYSNENIQIGEFLSQVTPPYVTQEILDNALKTQERRFQDMLEKVEKHFQDMLEKAEKRFQDMLEKAVKRFQDMLEKA